MMLARLALIFTLLGFFSFVRRTHLEPYFRVHDEGKWCDKTNKRLLSGS
jgi:hypothetical protein